MLSRRNDNFATEMMNIYKTAIGQPLFVDAPPMPYALARAPRRVSACATGR